MTKDYDYVHMFKEKLEFFLGEKIRIHVEKKDHQFWNGILIERKNDDIFVFKDDKLGLVHLFISEIYKIEEFQEVN